MVGFSDSSVAIQLVPLANPIFVLVMLPKSCSICACPEGSLAVSKVRLSHNSFSTQTVSWMPPASSFTAGTSMCCIPISSCHRPGEDFLDMLYSCLDTAIHQDSVGARAAGWQRPRAAAVV